MTKCRAGFVTSHTKPYFARENKDKIKQIEQITIDTICKPLRACLYDPTWCIEISQASWFSKTLLFF